MADRIPCKCPSCAASFKVDPNLAGRKVRCPRCQATFQVPAANPAAPAAAPPVMPADTAPAIPVAAYAPPPAEPIPIAMAVPDPPAPAAPAQPISTTVTAGEMNMPSFSLSINTTSDKPTTAPAKTRPAKSQKGPLLAIAAGGVALLLMLGGVAAFFHFGRSQDNPTAAADLGDADLGDKGQLVFDWPVAERRGASITIDGQSQPMRATGDVKFALPPGQHKIFLQRRGYEPIEQTVTLDKGKSEAIKPNWVASSVAVVPPPSETGGAAAVQNLSSSSAFPIGTGVSTSPAGFSGFLQNFDLAQRQAKEEKKDVLIVFARSDSDRDTQQLASTLQTAAVADFTRGAFVPVVIDFPRTREAYSLVEDTAQNRMLAEDYQITGFPVVALTDAEGRPYWIEREWKTGFNNLEKTLSAAQGKKAERDELLAATGKGTDEEQLAAAAKFVAWAKPSNAWPFYKTEIEAWYEQAQQIDPKNEKGLREVFFEPIFFIRTVPVDIDDATSIDQLATLMKPWLDSPFQDPDRAVKLHMMMARLLAGVERNDDAASHLTKATTYTPNDEDLAEVISSLKVALANRHILSSGTGFLVSQEGHLLTNHHVVEGEGKLVVRVPGEKDPIPATIVAQDEKRDMALIKADFPKSTELKPITLTATQLSRGSPVAAFGFPLGDVIGKDLKLTTGVVSSPSGGAEENMILLDVRVNPGNSGGPLCDKQGNVVGMVTAKTGGFGVDSYGMALPAEDLLQFLDANLPANAPRPSAEQSDQSKEWNEVDARVSPAVLMILKVKS